MSMSGITRRDFIKGSAATAAIMVSAGVSSTASAPTAGASKDLIRVGIIGTGAQGMLLLSNAIKLPNVDIVAAADIYEPHLEKAQIVAENAEGYSDYRKLLERKDIDAVIVATPLHMHAPISIDAMDAGKHVFCEKMMAYSIDQCKAMARKARSSKKVLQIGHQRRLNEGYRHAKRMINEEKVCGTLTQIRAQWHRNGSWRRAIPDPKFEKLLNWRMYKEFSQGLMAELGSHQIDAINDILGATPISVMGMGGIDYWKDGRDTYDNVSVIFEYPNGVKCVYTAITTNEHGGFYEQFMGTEGTLEVSTDKGLLFREPKADDLVWAPMTKKDNSQGKEAIILDAGATRKYREKAEGQALETSGEKDDYLVELEAFFDSVVTGKEPASNPQTALESCVTCLMANHAVNTGRKIVFRPEMFTI